MVCGVACGEKILRSNEIGTETPIVSMNCNYNGGMVFIMLPTTFIHIFPTGKIKSRPRTLRRAHLEADTNKDQIYK